MSTVDAFINQVKSLPPAPRVMQELLLVLREDDVDSARVVELITFDQALTAKLLQLCNSAIFAGAEPVQDLGGAVARLGFNQIYRLTVGLIGERTLGAGQGGYGIEPGELWMHSAATAVSGQVIARALKLEENLAFTASLLHDLGKLVLSSALEKAYLEVARQTDECGQSFLEAEKTILGVDHAEAGARLLQRWKFPEQLVQPVLFHHNPSLAGEHAPLAACVHLGDMIAHFLGYDCGHHAYAVRAHPEALELLELTAKDVDGLVLESDKLLKSFQLIHPH